MSLAEYAKRRYAISGPMPLLPARANAAFTVFVGIASSAVLPNEKPRDTDDETDGYDQCQV
jgi:hypothetical protein